MGMGGSSGQEMSLSSRISYCSPRAPETGCPLRALEPIASWHHSRPVLPGRPRWRRDVWGEANRNAKADPSACRSRKDAYNHFCNVSDAVMLHAAAPDEEHGEGETPAA
ncbi:unnamed protein product [Prorocentrum cordatum]|uniref:Uncharacterized protein n=1 Tax=Prorocentrum cordatum TaxID=2364126 RepID=A0ABN9PZ22_9DINO|nr:unnamed protein product [Polarella glacialis]